jgi:aminoglycoside phosphotransferase family enzyme
VIAAADIADRPAPQNVDIGRKVAFLSSPKAYAEQPARVEPIETHFSWVFLTDKHAYKLKKPLRDSGVDFATLGARHRNANQELHLNRRLARDVYIAVLPLTLDNGDLAIAGTGAVVDWLVQMRRLPAERMLDDRLARGDWCHADIEALGARLAGFFATARRAKVGPKAYPGRFRAESRLSRRALEHAGDPALRHAAEKIVRRLEAFICRRGTLLLRRAEQGRVVEGHGDLRPEHVCLGPAPLIIDCLEFRADLRYLDPVDELAFLAMECERLGAAGFGRILFYRYRLRTGDDPAPALVNFYKGIDALIRARLAILHLQEAPVRDPVKWPRRAAEYLAIAGQAIRHLDR